MFRNTEPPLTVKLPGLDWAMASLKPKVDTFFDKVTVMAEDKELMKNRVLLLMDVAGLFNKAADFTQIQAEI